MRRLALLALAGVLALTPSANGVIGGHSLDVRDAPWTAYVAHKRAGDVGVCSGAILDPTHVLTAAHCVLDGAAPVPPSALAVRAGVSNSVEPRATDRVQDRGVASFRVHPGYVRGEQDGADDVAVLTLASPLDLDGSTARAIALPSPSLALKLGSAASLSGFGSTVGGGEIDGTLNGMSSTLVDQAECLDPGDDDRYNGVLLCAYSGSSAPCSGDSGAALVLPGSSPVLIGVMLRGLVPCAANSVTWYGNMTAPELLQFVQGNDSPPSAPRPTGKTRLLHPTPVLQVGQTVQCAPGTWTGGPGLSYEFREGVNGTLLHFGPAPTYKLRDADVGRRLVCRVLATNAGGTSFRQSAVSSSAIRGAPYLTVQQTLVRRGGTATLEVKLRDWTRPYGKVDVCVTLAPRVGGKVCRDATPAGETATVAMRLKVKPTAPAVRARASVTARAADGRSASGLTFVQVR